MADLLDGLRSRVATGREAAMIGQDRPKARVGGRDGRQSGLWGLAVGQKVFLDVVAVGLEQHLGAAQLADLLVGPLDHAVALAAVGKAHLSGAGDLEALLGARLGLELGHLALLLREQPWAQSPAA